MAEFACADCGLTGPYQSFKVDPDAVAGGENEEFDPELECPGCEGGAVYET
ncbi:hypothetical protein [Rhodoferax sp.]|uniref:hypothetical protein n=1 Tax=Rhodoferax sp. TaxID=50421 RepID=UPI00271C8132|nr:hypothetical protein [Rhodoferax sp.]MDO9195872.1 hypothetical protein [Rhodoferax sp.]